MVLVQSADLHHNKPQRPVLVSVNTKSDPDSDLQFLKQHALFAGLEAADLKSLYQHSKKVLLRHHELLYRQGMTAQYFFFVLSGRIRLYRLDSSGVDRTLDSHGAGDCFAEVMIYADPPNYACYAEALKSSEVLMIPVRAYQELLERRPAYNRAALRHYAMRAVSRFHDLEIMTVQNARDRLIRYLIDLLPGGLTVSGEVELPLPKCLVASRLAMQPETFSRILADLKSAGLVRVNRSRLFIPDPQRLIGICQ